MAQWGQQPQQTGFQYPMQTGFPGPQQPQQFQQQPQQFQQQPQQFQGQPQFQQGNLGLGVGGGPGLLPQQTGFPGQRPGGVLGGPTGFQQQQGPPPVPQIPQQTGFPGGGLGGPGSGFIQAQATGFPGAAGGFGQQRAPPPPVPPIPSQFQQQGGLQQGGQLGGPQQGLHPLQQNRPSFLNAPPPPQGPNRLLSASPGLVPQATGFAGGLGGGGGIGPLVPQVTGFVDPRLQMLSQTFGALGGGPSASQFSSGPSLLGQGQNLVQSIQEYNQAQRGSANQTMGWALSKSEKKNYDKIFRAWDVQGTGFITGTVALEKFGDSGLPRDDLARIWTLADMHDRGKLNIAEFHVAMGLIYRRLNGMQIPDQLPPELIPPSVADLDSTVDRVKELLKSDTRTGSAASNKHSFNASSPSPLGIDARRDASNYKHSDSEPPGGFYRPSNRHVDRSAIRSRNEEDSPAADLNDMKRALENTAHMLDRAHEADAKRTKEDEELEQEMEDLKYRVKRVQDDLNYVSRGPKTAAREEERRRLEREMLQLMHEKIPEVERKIKARDERKERERREWARERDRANERFGRYDRTGGYDDRDRDRDRPYSRGDYDRPYSRGLDDRDRPYSRGALDDRDRPYSRGAGGYDRDRDRDRDRDYDDRYRSGRDRDRDRDREYDRDRPRSPPRSPAPPASAPAPPAASAPAAPAPPISPAPSSSTPNLKAMTPAERAAYLREQAQRKVQERMAALGIASPAPSSPGGAGAGAGQSASGLDVSVEDRLAQEKKEAEEKAREAERLAEERERNRRERVERERGIKEGAQAAVTPTPTSTAPPPQPTPRAAPPAPAAPAAKAAPPPPKPRGTAPPPPAPRRAAAPPAPPAPRGAPAAPTRAPVAPTPPRAPSFQAPPPPAPAPVPVQEEEDPEEKALREREERLRKQKEERERRMRQLEEEERAAEEEFERERQRRLEAARARSAQPVVESPPAPVPPAPAAVPPTPERSAAPSFTASATTSPAEKSTNPFSRLIKEGAASAATSPSAGAANASPNPWASAAAAPSPPVAPPAPPAPQPPSRQQTSSIPPPSSTRSPAPPTSKSPAPKSSYQTAPSSLDDDDWDDIKEKSDDDDDSSDDEIARSRAARQGIAESLFRGIMPSATPPVGRPGSAASGGGLKSPTSPAFGAGGTPPAPPPPAAPPAPPAPGAPAPPPAPAPAAPRIQAPAPTSASGPGDVSALMKSIQSGMRLRPTKTVDKSGPPVSGKVLGDAAPPEHINAAPRAPSPPQQHEAYPEPTPMGGNHEDFASKSSNRQSVGWFADRAADLGASPTSPSPSAAAFASHMPPMVEEKDEEDDSDDMYVKDVDVSHHSHSSGASEGYEVVSKPSSLGDSGMGVPQITVDEHRDEAGPGEGGLMADIDRGVEHRVRSLYAFEGDGPEDLSFPENVVIVANPSKTGGDWWYGTMVQTGKSGLFPKTYVEVVTPRTAKAAFAYEASNPDELAFSEGETLSIIDTSEEEWWKAERGGVVYIVPAAYLELVEGMTHGNGQQVQSAKVENRLPSADASVPTGPPLFASLAHAARADGHEDDQDDPDKPTMRHAVDEGAGLHGQRDPSSTSTILGHEDDDTETDSDSDIDSDYLSFEESDDEGEEASATATAADKAARERERQLVLEAAGLIVNKDVGRPPARARSVRRGHGQQQQLKVRGPSAGGQEQEQPEEQHQQHQQHHRRPAPAAPGPRRVTSMYKDLPPVPPSEPVSHEAALDDAFARYEYFKNNQATNNINRLSVISTDSAVSGIPSSPTTSTAPSREGKERERERDAEGGRYSHFLHFLRSGGNRTPEDGDRSAQKRSVSTLTISSPMPIGGGSSATSSTSAVDGGAVSPSRSSSPSFGMSWASLVDKNALEGIPPGERKRQEAIFELINTEVAYVRDLQLIVEVFYSSMIPMLSQKEVTVVFANVEDLLLTNTAFVSSLEERQKDCRLYIDKIGDILLTHIPSMAVYTEYCVNQSVAIKVLKSLRDSNPELAGHLQRLRDENPRVRNLDLSSYLLAPMQRITRYPLLIKQILHYTEVGDEYEAIKTSQDMAEKILDHINETIREQEGYETLKKLSQDLWIGKGRLDLTAPTKFMGPRRLVREGPLAKAKSGKRLHAFLCSDILVLVDDSMKNLYRLPIPLAHAQVSGSRDETAFQITQAYPRGGESVSLRAPSAKDCQQWVQEIGSAGRRARHAEERAARRAGRR